MDERSTFAECLVRSIDDGYDLDQVGESCAEKAEGRLSDEEIGKSDQGKSQG